MVILGRRTLGEGEAEDRRVVCCNKVLETEEMALGRWKAVLEGGP